MKICTQTSALKGRFGDERTIEILAQNGFDCIDYTMSALKNPESHFSRDDEYADYAKLLREKAESCGISFYQAHAPSFWGQDPPYPPKEEWEECYFQYIDTKLKRSLDICGLLGIKVCVIHPITNDNPEIQHELNMKLYRSLEDTAAKNGVKIALENMYIFSSEHQRLWHACCSRPEEFNAYLDELGEENFTGCLDLGHCELVDIPAQDMIRAMGGKRLTALHVHDNDKIDDLHTLPFTKSMDWTEITKALHDINYTGVLTFEADKFIRAVPTECSVEASKVMADVGRLLCAMTGL